MPYRCGKDGQFIPLLMATGSQPGVLYCGEAIGFDSNDPVSIVAFI